VAQRPDELTGSLIQKGKARGGDPDAVVRMEANPAATSRQARVPLATRPPPAPINLKPLNVRVPIDIHERLGALNFYTRMSIQELVTRMLDEGLDAIEREIQRQGGKEP
jgi:hypothetical protein